MYSTDRSKSSSAPAVTTPVAAVGTTTGAGNAARQEDLGLAQPAPATTAGSSTEALRAMGSMGSVVLDAMPMGAALRAAWTLRDMDWARAWMLSQETGDVLAEGAEVLEAALDEVWPVGLGFGIADFGNAAVVLQVGGKVEGTIVRLADALSISVAGSAEAMLQQGIGATVLDARGEAWLGAAVGAAEGPRAQVSMGWTLPTVFSFLPAPVSREVFRMLVQGAPQGALALMKQAIDEYISTALPDEFRFEHGGSAGVDAAAGLGLAGTAEAGLEATWATGWGDHGQYVQATIGVASAATAWIFESLAGAGATEDVFEAARGITLRVEGDPQALARKELDGARFVVTSHRSEGENDSFVTSSIFALVSWLCSWVNGPEGEREVPVADVSLRREVERPLDQLPPESLPEVLRWAETKLPDHGPLVGYGETTASAEVVVGPDAARAASGRVLFAAEGQTAEEATLDAERAIAAEMIGGTTAEWATVYDLDAGVALARLEHAERTAALTFGAGGGLNLEEGIGEGALAAENVTVFYREDLDAKEAREALIAAK